MGSNAIETAIRDAYAARARNDAAELALIFAPDATFRDMGHPAYCSAAATSKGPEIRTALEKLCEVFPASGYDLTSMITEGDRAAVICRANFRYAPTGESLTLDLMQFWTFKDGKVIELLEFFDTAHVAHVMAQG
jgi:ketosteroid isomerase-like protein